MVITSFYSVFATKHAEEFSKMLGAEEGLKICHQFANDDFEYYVMKDSCGNTTDLIDFKKKEVKSGFFAIRINVTDFDAMQNALLQVGYKQEGNLYETASHKQGFFVSSVGGPSIVLFEHKK